MSEPLTVLPAVASALVVSGIFIYGLIRLVRTHSLDAVFEELSAPEDAPVETAEQKPTATRSSEHSHANELRDTLAALLEGDVTDEATEIKKYSRDTSIFTQKILKTLRSSFAKSLRKRKQEKIFQ
jgi:hypothetical protein